MSDQNLLRQYDYLKTTILVSLEENQFPVNRAFMCELNKHAVEYLAKNPGEIRKCPIYIKNSDHSPPDHGDVEEHLKSFFNYFADNWNAKTAIHLSAYALWGICWIHPFVEGNGRTARAFAYFVLCAKLSLLLPGKDNIPHQIRANRGPYYKALRAADLSYDGSSVDLTELETYLDGLLLKQLSA